MHCPSLKIYLIFILTECHYDSDCKFYDSGEICWYGQCKYGKSFAITIILQLHRRLILDSNSNGNIQNLFP